MKRISPEMLDYYDEEVVRRRGNPPSLSTSAKAMVDKSYGRQDRRCRRNGRVTRDRDR